MTLAPKEPNFFFNIANGQFPRSPDCMANDGFSEPPRRTEFKNPFSLPNFWSGSPPGPGGQSVGFGGGGGGRQLSLFGGGRGEGLARGLYRPPPPPVDSLPTLVNGPKGGVDAHGTGRFPLCRGQP